MLWWDVYAERLEVVLSACGSDISPASKWAKTRTHLSCSAGQSAVQGQHHLTYKLFLRGWSARRIVIARRVTNHGVCILLWQHNIAQIIIKSFTVRARLDNAWWQWVHWCWSCKTLCGTEDGFVVRGTNSPLLHVVKHRSCSWKVTSKGRSPKYSVKWRRMNEFLCHSW